MALSLARRIDDEYATLIDSFVSLVRASCIQTQAMDLGQVVLFCISCPSTMGATPLLINTEQGHRKRHDGRHGWPAC